MNRARFSLINSAPGRLDRDDQAPDGSLAKIRLAQQEQLDYWAAFWRGLNQEQQWNRQNERGERRPVYELYDVPKRRSWMPDTRGRDPTRPRMRQVGQRLPGYVQYYIIEAQNNSERLRRADGEIMRGENPIMTPLQPLGFRFRKVLGQGGGGIAILVDLLDENGKADQWVIKAPLGGRSGLSREARNMRLMVGARHMVQRKFIRVPDRNVPSNQVTLNTDSPDCIIGMELLKHGSLDGLLRKVSAQNLKLRDDELWMIFHCLFRGCVAMSRPGTWSGGFNPERDPIPLQDEELPRYGPIETAASILHFDLDPDNILVGDYEADPGSHTHETVPIIKISDLGVAQRLNELQRIRDDTLEMIYTRRFGKVENHTPEQFTQEWDYLAGPPSATNEPVAGNYSWKNNLFAVGNVMWMLMTRCCTRLPPVGEHIEMKPGDEDWIAGLTYGRDLVNGSGMDYDATLKSLIMWCMMHDPAQRPDFHQLDSLIVGNLRWLQTSGGDQNTAGRTAIRDILTTPPPPPAPAPPSPPRASNAATLAGIAAGEGGDPGTWILGPNAGAAIQHVRFTSSGWQAFDAGIEGAGGARQPAVSGARRSQVRAAARNAFRRGGGGLRNLAQRAGRGIRRVVRGAVRRVTGSGGSRRQTQLGSATVARPAGQEVGGVRDLMFDVDLALAFAGLTIPRTWATGRRRPTLRPQTARDNLRTP